MVQTTLTCISHLMFRGMIEIIISQDFWVILGISIVLRPLVVSVFGGAVMEMIGTLVVGKTMTTSDLDDVSDDALVTLPGYSMWLRSKTRRADDFGCTAFHQPTAFALMDNNSTTLRTKASLNSRAYALFGTLTENDLLAIQFHTKQVR